jgi:hypothetical protein
VGSRSHQPAIRTAEFVLPYASSHISAMPKSNGRAQPAVVCRRALEWMMGSDVLAGSNLEKLIFDCKKQEFKELLNVNSDSYSKRLRFLGPFPQLFDEDDHREAASTELEVFRMFRNLLVHLWRVACPMFCAGGKVSLAQL